MLILAPKHRITFLLVLLPLLASALEFGSAAAPALTALLKMASWLAPEEFTAKILPTVVKLFASNDRAIRRTIAGSLLKYLSKLQVDEEAGIRTNTTILLVNIASYLNDGTRKRVLINAFTVRALRDTFSPARGAGIMALCATSSYYDTMEIATRILPNIVVLTIDPDSDVRSKAFQAVDQFLQIVKQHDEQINSGDTSGTSSMGMSAGNAGLLGWAMSSLTMKGKADEAPVASAGSSSQLTTTASNASSVMAPPEDTVPTYPAFTADTADLPVPSSPSSTDGWGEIENGIFEEEANDEKDKWDDVEPLEEPKPAAFANIQAAQKRPIVQPKSQVTSVKPKSAVRVVKDEDDDLWGSIAAPAPRSTSSTSSNIRASSSASSLNMRASSSKADDDDPWAAIAAPPPTTRAKPLSLGRGRGTKPAAPKLGAQRVNRTSSGGV